MKTILRMESTCAFFRFTLSSKPSAKLLAKLPIQADILEITNQAAINKSQGKKDWLHGLQKYHILTCPYGVSQWRNVIVKQIRCKPL